MAIVGIIYLGLVVLMIVSMWKIYTKAGKPGWACLIPIYNIIVWLEIARKPWWWIFLIFFVPYVGAFIWGIWALNMVVKNFGKDVGFTIGCIFLPFIFIPILGLGDAQYIGAETDTGDSQILDADIK